jgi:hypothetical protein
MSYLTRMALAVALGIAAAAANWIYLSIQTHPTPYVGIANNIKQGSIIQESDLLAVPVPGDPADLRKTLIPFSSRAILFGSKAVRDYQQGDIVFARDIVGPVGASEWEVIGPFQLISVGERFTKDPAQVDAAIRGNTRGNTVTIAVDADFDLQTSRLLSVIAGGRDNNPVREPSIVAVQIVPSKGGRQAEGSPELESSRAAAAAEFFASDGPGSASNDSGSLLRNRNSSGASSPRRTVYQTVSLDGIPNVPAVLLEGDFIRFVIPRNAPSSSAGR